MFTQVTRSLVVDDIINAAKIDGSDAAAIRTKLGITSAKPVRRQITSNDSATQLFRAMTALTGTRQQFQTAEAGLVLVSSSLDIIHRGISIGGTDQYPVGIACRCEYRFAATQAGLAAASPNWIKYAYAGGNISSLDDHYGQNIFARIPQAVGAGWHQFMMFATSHSSVGGGTTDGLAMLNIASSQNDYNYMMTEFYPDAVLS